MNKDRRKTLAQAIALLQGASAAFEEARSLVETAAEEEQEFFDNMPENMQGTERGEKASETADSLQALVSEMEDANVEDWIASIEEAMGA